MCGPPMRGGEGRVGDPLEFKGVDSELEGGLFFSLLGLAAMKNFGVFRGKRTQLKDCFVQLLDLKDRRKKANKKKNNCGIY
ncbi:hypothetical protein TNCT_457791 [Trichonephila clavata]|uniref:Uncharacterized protein n=1 Tax=Trichonephila clavata TaxID=2740835 RepID=A0A8X6FFR3_TRICU|nr:hypothetical protein TNCT_457791 [Trichonephila clavata]